MIDYKKLAEELAKDPEFCRALAEETVRLKQRAAPKMETLHDFDFTNHCKHCRRALWTGDTITSLNEVCPKAEAPQF